MNGVNTMAGKFRSSGRWRGAVDAVFLGAAVLLLTPILFGLLVKLR